MAVILVTGANGQLGSELRQASKSFYGYDFAFTDIAELNITDAEKTLNFIGTLKPDWIINCAAYNAVDKAEKRGGKESLVMVDDMAFIVNVKDRVVVTALDSKNRGEGVFTQIDSVVFADPSEANKNSSINIEK